MSELGIRMQDTPMAILPIFPDIQVPSIFLTIIPELSMSAENFLIHSLGTTINIQMVIMYILFIEVILLL